MKLSPSFFIMIILLFLVTGIQSQDLHIIQGNKTKTFKIGHLIRVDLPIEDSIECKKCPKNYIVGRIVSYHNTVLTLRIRVQSEPIAMDKKEIGTKGRVYKEKMEAEWPIIEIPATSILGITKQGTKKWSPLNAGDMYGGTFVAVGTFFMLAAWTAEDETNQDALLGSGITMASIGLAMVTIFNRKTYEIENPLNSNSKNKPWKIK